MTQIAHALSVLLAGTYTLYLKTQNYHWHVKGPQFNSLHLLFETQYQQLSESVDQIAERLIMKGHQAPATFKQFIELSSISEGNASLSANQMIIDLIHDYDTLITELKQCIESAQNVHDEATVTLLGDLIAQFEKNRWMLNASKE